MELVTASLDRLPAYLDALRRGWSPDNLRPEAAQEEKNAISDDPGRFVGTFDDPDAAGDPITLPDGSCVPRLPSTQRWIWDGGFCGRISLRWQPGTEDLPPHCSGHLGYSIVPWRRREGLATAALRAFLPEAGPIGLSYVEAIVHPANVASIKVIESAGGYFVERFCKHASLGGGEALRYRITLEWAGANTGVPAS